MILNPHAQTNLTTRTYLSHCKWVIKEVRYYWRFQDNCYFFVLKLFGVKGFVFALSRKFLCFSQNCGISQSFAQLLCNFAISCFIFCDLANICVISQSFALFLWFCKNFVSRNPLPCICVISQSLRFCCIILQTHQDNYNRTMRSLQQRTLIYTFFVWPLKWHQ